MKALAAILGCYGRLWLLNRALSRIRHRRFRLMARIASLRRRQVGLATRRGTLWLLCFTLAGSPLWPGRDWRPQFRTTRVDFLSIRL